MSIFCSLCLLFLFSVFECMVLLYVVSFSVSFGRSHSLLSFSLTIPVLPVCLVGLILFHSILNLFCNVLIVLSFSFCLRTLPLRRCTRVHNLNYLCPSEVLTMASILEGSQCTCRPIFLRRIHAYSKPSAQILCTKANSQY